MTLGGFRLWPRSLATRTALVLLTGLMLVQIAGLTIHALDRIDMQQVAQTREVAGQIFSLFRAVAATPADRRAEVLAAMHRNARFAVVLSDAPPATELPPMPLSALRRFWMAVEAGPLLHMDRSTGGGMQERRSWANSDFMRRNFGTPGVAPVDIVAHGGLQTHRMAMGIRLSDGSWLNFQAELGPPRPWHSPTFMGAFGLMTAVAAGLTLWAVRRLTQPVRVLAAAAEALGRDVNAPPLPETGPEEVATAAVAFNTMARRIRRFVDDRTTLLTAIGHDLRTPITRLKLRAEFMDDDDLRSKMLCDLEELEAMVAATLAFGRDAQTAEPVVSLDLAELLRTILDEAGDARPQIAERLAFEGPSHFTVRVRSLAMKRALTNLVSNAIAYGGAARVRLVTDAAGTATIAIEDDGPGIPPEELERVFEPFYRVESSRNRETGGTGLGLPIARDILRAHGGDAVLANRPSGGLVAKITLPV
ncbi:MAG: ATP-binding protein [Rhodospirillales bacterium]